MGVKCNRTFGLSSGILHLAVLVGGKIVEHDVNFSGAAGFPYHLVKKSTNSALVCRRAVLPSTVPVFTFKAAYNESVPCR